MTSSDLWDAEAAERFDETSALMFASEVLEPAVPFWPGWPAMALRSSSRSVRDWWPFLCASAESR